MIDVDHLLGLPLRYVWEGATADAREAPADADAALLERAVAIAERMPPSVEGHGGDEALFRAACEIATVLGEDHAAIEAVLENTFNPRCLPPWPAAKLAREAREAAKRQADPVLRMQRRHEARAAAAAADPGYTLGTLPEAIGAVFVQADVHRSPPSLFFYDPRIEGFRETSLASLHVALRLSGADSYCATRDGKKLIDPARIVNESNTIQMYNRTITDFSQAKPVEVDEDQSRVVLGVLVPTIAPIFDAAVAAWLAALAPRCGLAIYEWIASLKREAIHRNATALCLIGPHGAGKTIFAIACAKLWGAAPVELGHVAAQFNASMATCPVVLDDECKCLAKRTVSTEEFRVLVQARERAYEPKGKERRTLIGAQRFILTANDLSALTFSNAVGTGAADAIAERLTVVSLSKAEGAAATLALDACRTAEGDVDFERVCGHLRWVQENTPLPDGRTRFLGACDDKAEARTAVVANVIAENEAVFERVRAVLVGEQKTSKTLFLAKSALWVKATDFASDLAGTVTSERYDMKRVRNALAPFRGESGAVRLGDKVVRAWELDPVRLTEALGLDVDTVLAALEAAP